MECNVYVRTQYGGYWKRGIANLIDCLLLGIVFAIVSFSSNILTAVVELVIFLAYMIGLKFAFGATLGYRLLGMQIVSINGAKPTVKQIAIRLIAAFVSALAFGLGYLWIALDKNKQAWHDKIAGTYVIRLAYSCLKQILLVIVLLGGGYYVKTYHAKEGKPNRIETPPVAEIQKPKPKLSSIEELPKLLDESRELLESIREQENRLKNQASARRSSGNASSRRINFQALKNHKGQWVTILMKDGLQREGRIVDVKENILHLEQDYDYGTISVRVPIQNIADVHE